LQLHTTFFRRIDQQCAADLFRSDTAIPNGTGTVNQILTPYEPPINVARVHLGADAVPVSMSTERHMPTAVDRHAFIPVQDPRPPLTHHQPAWEVRAERRFRQVDDALRWRTNRPGARAIAVRRRAWMLAFVVGLMGVAIVATMGH
jgi:hypothetical protein